MLIHCCQGLQHPFRTLAVLAIGACGVNQTPQPDPVPPLPSCIPNRDSVIDASELPIAVGATLTYYAGSNRTVDLAGKSGVFDLSDERPDDMVVALGPVALATQWYADQFPAGQFAVDAGSGLDGIYHQDERALWLDGTASQQMTPSVGKTLVRYLSPIAVLRFPLVDGESYSTTVAMDPATTIDGLPFVGADRVDVDVSAGARLDVPYVEFSPIMRVRTHVTRTPSTGTPVVGKRTTIFLFECFGEVARAESKQDEPAADFTSAAYLRRFALGQRGDGT